MTIPFLVVAVTYFSADAREADIPFQSIVPNSWTSARASFLWAGALFHLPGMPALVLCCSCQSRGGGNQVAPPAPERVTHERQGGDWVVSSGYRGDRIFYRKAILACHGTKWRHIEFEYPASEKRLFDGFVTRTSFALRAYQDVGCRG